MKPALLALPLLLLAACGDGRRAPVGGGLEELGLAGPVRRAQPLIDTAREAPFEYGRPNDLIGRPAAAARAAAEIEAFANATETDPLWTHPRNGLLLPQLQIARREFRGALGVPSSVPSEVAIRAFAGAAQALRAGDGPGAEAALAPVGGAVTLARLGNLPPLPRVAEAAQYVANEVNGRHRNR